MNFPFDILLRLGRVLKREAVSQNTAIEPAKDEPERDKLDTSLLAGVDDVGALRHLRDADRAELGESNLGKGKSKVSDSLRTRWTYQGDDFGAGDSLLDRLLVVKLDLDDFAALLK